MFQSYLYGIEIAEVGVSRHTSQSFNRTFMELKWGISFYKQSSFACFNRTFMELKFKSYIHTGITVRVSIVPLWNWNTGCDYLFEFTASFNRTFMELK